MKKIVYLTLILNVAFLITTSGCVSNTRVSDITTSDASIYTTESYVTETTKEPTETAAASTTAKPTEKVTATPTPTVEEPTAATTTKASETTLPAATTKATSAPAGTTKPATTKAPIATTAATAVATTAAPPVETAPPLATTAAYTPNCDNIRNIIVSNLQSRGYWFPDAVSIGDDSAAVTTNYFYSDEKFAEGFLGKFTNIDKLGIGVISVNVWIENGYVWFSSTKCAYPAP